MKPAKTQQVRTGAHIVRYKGFRFFLHSNEGSPREPLHVHVRLGSSQAKLWPEPQVRVASSFGFDARTLHESVEVAQGNRALIERSWHEYFSQSGALRR